MDRVNWVTKDCLNAINQLIQVPPHLELQPEVVHGRLCGYVDTMFQRAREAGFPERDVRQLAYAIVALADEVAAAKAGALQEYWSIRPLQMVYFGENVAGENFFTHLEQVRQTPERGETLRVFYLCLMFGFEGRYRVRGAQLALSELIETVRHQLLSTLPMPKTLSPNGLRPEEGLLDAGRDLPIVWTALGMVALAGVLYLGLAVSLREQVDALIRWVSSATGA